MRRGEKRYNYIYKTTCNINSKFYIGLHSTDNLNDGYMGSGTNIRKSIKKYGKENHSVDILEFLDSRKELKIREKEIINENTLDNYLCINIIRGGTGLDELTLEHSKITRERISKTLSVPYSELYGEEEAEIQRRKRSEAAKKAWADMDTEKRKQISEKISEKLIGMKQSEESIRKGAITRTGVKKGPMSEETKKKLSESLIAWYAEGNKNSNYGNKLSEATKKKLSDINKGRIVSEETRKKISEGNKRRKTSDETKKKIAESLSGRNKEKLS